MKFLTNPVGSPIPSECAAGLKSMSLEPLLQGIHNLRCWKPRSIHLELCWGWPWDYGFTLKVSRKRSEERKLRIRAICWSKKGETFFFCQKSAKILNRSLQKGERNEVFSLSSNKSWILVNWFWISHLHSCISQWNCHIPWIVHLFHWYPTSIPLKYVKKTMFHQ
jgi:hypothetical protein